MRCGRNRLRPGSSSSANWRRAIGGVVASLAWATTAWAATVGESFYRLDAAIDFNVLDSARIDPATGALTLKGHRDARYGDARIPYLDHLATLLAHPDPQFTLTWTPESEARVERLFRRLDSADEVRALAARWGEWIDQYDQVTPMGRFFMPLFGVQVPTNNRYEIAAAIVRGAGNERGGRILEQAGAARAVLGTAQEQDGMAGLLRAIGAYSVMNQLKGQVERGEISDADGQYRFGLAIAERLEGAFDLSSRPVSSAYERSMNSSGDLGTSLTAAMHEFDNQLRTILEQAMYRVWEKQEQVIVPPEVLAETVGATVEVVPECIRLEPTSQLARVMFDADYLGKQLPNRADLEGRIPGYQTDFSFERSHPAAKFQSRASQHMWVSIDEVDFAESADRQMLATRGVKMRFNIRDLVDGKSVPAPPGEYEQLLTSLYERFATEYPVLHELREAAKLAVVARWVRARVPEFALPASGRTPASPPTRAPGLLYLAWSPKPGAISASLMAMGGMDFVVAPKDLPFDRNFPAFSSAPAIAPASSEDADPVLVAKTIGRALGAPAPQPLATVESEQTEAGLVTAVTIVPAPPAAVATAEAPARVAERPAGAALVVWDEKALRADLEQERAAMAAAKTPRERALHQMRVAQTLHDLGDTDAALKEFREALGVAPDLPIVRLMLAKALFDTGDFEGAATTLREYLQLEPSNAPAAKLLADLEAKKQAGPLPGGSPASGTSPFATGPKVAFGPSIAGAVTGRMFEGSRAEQPASGVDTGIADPKAVPGVGTVRELSAERAATYQALTERKTQLVARQKVLEKELGEVQARRAAGDATPETAMKEKRLKNQIATTGQAVADVDASLLSLTLPPSSKTEPAKPPTPSPDGASPRKP